jgi:hypothetical protein
MFDHNTAAPTGDRVSNVGAAEGCDLLIFCSDLLRRINLIQHSIGRDLGQHDAVGNAPRGVALMSAIDAKLLKHAPPALLKKQRDASYTR